MVMEDIPKSFRVRSEDVTVFKDKHIGAGNFADVFKGTYHKKGSKGGMEVAVKVIRAGPTLNSVEKESTPAWLHEIRNEAMIMTLFDQEHLILLYGYSDVDMDASPFQPPFIVLEYCPGGSLDVYLQATKNISVGEKVLYLKEVAAGMRFLEKEKIVHRDLASRNVLINTCGLLKISDFGLSRSPNVKEMPETTHNQIPIRWMAPESLLRTPTFDNKSDMWAYGVFIYEVFTAGKKPWPNKPVKWIATQIRKLQMPHLPSSMPKVIKDIIQHKCWVKADERWTFAQLHSVLCLLSITLFTTSRASIYAYLEKKGVAQNSKGRDKVEKWDRDSSLVEWSETKDIAKHDTVPARPVDGNCVLYSKKKGEKRERKNSKTNRELNKTPAISHTTTTSQGSSEDRNRESEGRKHA
ncbi:unnamed protein product [Bursaphelenchus okinawaensis]|uniref:Protein kinase domain-containing protein n=1 Tax=Bursaphelenchus okinawaensis TaxID=465554 RepID=A0A811L9X9_9BILA|nr:unnamed protein product [Bursaphelenchus okinawaensis]CAG9119920.1 unnamed protein product [Bursaphelenchus okinawaensis]